MKMATISETKNRLSALLEEVRQGESILILDRNHPVARLEPLVDLGQSETDGALDRLERAGIVRRARAPRARKGVLTPAPPRTRTGTTALAALLADRESAR